MIPLQKMCFSEYGSVPLHFVTLLVFFIKLQCNVLLNNAFFFVAALNQVLFPWLVQWSCITSISIWGGQRVREPYF